MVSRFLIDLQLAQRRSLQLNTDSTVNMSGLQWAMGSISMSLPAPGEEEIVEDECVHVDEE